LNERSEKTIEEQTGKLDAIDQATLTPLVQRSLGRKTVQVINWDLQQIHGGLGGGLFTTALYRFTGQGHDQEKIVPWSLILKTFSPDTKVNLHSPYYPRREADAYQSGWLDNLPGGLAAPACYGVIEHPDGEVWVWLEEIVDEIGPRWPLERFGLAARHLGQFNGAYLIDLPLPTWPWLSVNWLRRAVEKTDTAIIRLTNVNDNPLLRSFFPGDARDRFLQFWTERVRLLDALDRLPRTICHLDAFSRNLFSRRSAEGDQTIAIDWAFVGYGAVGEELEPLVCRSLGFSDVEIAQAQELDAVVFSGYLAGLRDAGWQGDPQQVRLGFTAAVTLRYMVTMGHFLPLIIDGSIRFRAPQLFGIPYEEFVDFVVALQRFTFHLADEAMELLDNIP
jgi:hypothetical protein